MIGYIYHITNLENNKKYIGCTIDYHRRKTTHLSMLRNGNHHSIKLQRAWNKYKESSFEFSYFNYEIKNLEELKILEKKEIELYDSYINGYNMTIGGDGSVRWHFSFDEYCFIRVGNESYEGMFRKTANYFQCDNSVISDIINEKTYPHYSDIFKGLKAEEREIYKKAFESTFEIDENNPPKILNRKKVDDEVLLICLCIMNKYDQVGKTLEEILSYSRGTMSALKRGVRYKKIYNKFLQMREDEINELAIKYYEKWNVEEVKQKRLDRQSSIKRPCINSDIKRET